MGSKLLYKRTNSYLPTLQLKVKTKVEGLITYSLDQQIFKFKITSGNNQELWEVNVDFKSSQNKWTIDAILQHMGFYSPTENPCVMMRENIKAQSSEYVVI